MTTWVLQHISQAIIIVDAMNFCRFTEDYLNPEMELDRQEWYQARLALITDLVSVVRGDLDSIQRLSMFTLMTQNIHFRDVSKELW